MSVVLELLSIAQKIKTSVYIHLYVFLHSKHFRWIPFHLPSGEDWGLHALRLRQLLTTNSPFSTLDVSSMNSSKLAGRFQSSAEQTERQPCVSACLWRSQLPPKQRLSEMLPLQVTVPLMGRFGSPRGDKPGALGFWNSSCHILRRLCTYLELCRKSCSLPAVTGSICCCCCSITRSSSQLIVLG